MIELSAINRVFVANRGLPAIEIVDAVQAMGLEAVIAAAPSDTRSAAYAKASARTGLPVSETHIERDSYVNMQWILEAAQRLEADAIHPGYGFLSEDPDFARRVELHGMHFIGPTENALRVFGSKTQFRQHAREAGVPVIPASRPFVYTQPGQDAGVVQTGINRGISGIRGVGKVVRRGYNLSGLSRVGRRFEEYPNQFARAVAGTLVESVLPMSLEDVVDEAITFIQRHGDIVVKSPYGGGGMGTVPLHGIKDALEDDYPLAYSQVKSAVQTANRTSVRAKRRGVYFEKLITEAAHLEMQAVADKYGNVHIMEFERDCSWQLKERKMVEQSPSSKISDEERQQLRAYAHAVISTIGSHGVFTIEFLKAGDTGELFALEVNPRLQVEHKVTEQVTWVNGEQLELIPLQIKIATGERLDTFSQQCRGHSVEARIIVYVDEAAGGYIEDMSLPSGEGIMVISNFDGDHYVPGGYDGMVMKVVATGSNAEEANGRLLNALQHTRLTGVQNNIDFVVQNMQRQEFQDGSYTTGFISGVSGSEVFRFQ